MPWSTNHVLQIVENMFGTCTQQIMFFSESCDAELRIRQHDFFFFYLYYGGG